MCDSLAGLAKSGVGSSPQTGKPSPVTPSGDHFGSWSGLLLGRPSSASSLADSDEVVARELKETAGAEQKAQGIFLISDITNRLHLVVHGVRGCGCQKLHRFLKDAFEVLRT